MISVSTKSNKEQQKQYYISKYDLFLIISLMDHRDSLFTCLIVLVSLFLCVSTFQIWLIYLNSVLILSLLYLYLSVSVPPAAFHRATNSKTDGDPLGGGKVYTLRHKNNLHIILNVYSLKQTFLLAQMIKNLTAMQEI